MGATIATRTAVLGCILLLLNGCAALAPPEPVENTEPVIKRSQVFQVPLLSEPTKFHFATLTLFREMPNQTRVVLDAKERIEHVTLSIALPNCFSLAGPRPSSVWVAVDLAAGVHEWAQPWAQSRTKCVGGGTLLYAVSGERNGDKGSIPFQWSAAGP